MRDGRLILGWIQPDDERPAALTWQWPCRKRSWGVIMLADLKPYAEMRDSGVEWLGEVPAHWDVQRLAQFGTLSKGSGGNKDDERSAGVPCIRYGDLYTTHHNFIQRSRSFISNEKVAEYTTTRFGDVLFASSGETIDEIGKSAANVMQADACCGGDVIIFRPTESVDARYLGYVMDCPPVAAQKARMGRGITVMHIYAAQLKYLVIPLPPLMEQAAIVRVLDDADRRIQRYIHAKQKLLALLEEQRQAVIHEAVTGQIDVRTGQPYSAYKSSGVDWLGSVPVRWEVAPLRRVTLDRCDGPFGSGLKSSHYTDQGIRVVRLQNIGHGEFRDSDATFISPEHYSSLGDHSVLSGDVLIAGLGDNNHPAGRACVAPEGIIPAMVKADCFRFRLNIEHIRPRFAALQLTATATLASAALSTGATRQRTNLKATAGRAISIPSVSEQNLIVQYIKAEVSSITGVQTAVQEKIRLLNEYRARLIADVVTGKFDVRDAAAELPEDNGRGVSEELADELAVDQEVIL